MAIKLDAEDAREYWDQLRDRYEDMYGPPKQQIAHRQAVFVEISDDDPTEYDTYVIELTRIPLTI